MSLGKISLGKMSLGRISLGRHGGEVSASGGTSPLFRQILAKMEAEQPELKESLVAWYSPNLQGLTNAQLYSTDKEYTNGLRDLSGNNNHMTLYGFGGVEGEGHVDGDGNLVFDGNDDYSVASAIKALEDYTFISKRKHHSYVARTYYVQKGNGAESNGAFLVEKRTAESAYYSRSFGQQTQVSSVYDNEIVIQSKTKYNGATIGIGTFVDSEAALTIAKVNSFAYDNVTMNNVVLFDRTLTDTEIEWVKTNMLVSQEVTKHKVTLWYEGTKLGVLNVQNGNTIDPSEYGYDYDFYYDVDFEVPYLGEAIMQDTNLYANE